MQTTADLISIFETWVDDATELSSSEELILANKIYRKILNKKDWEFLKKEYNSAAVAANYVTLPTDFSHICENGNYTDDCLNGIITNSSPKVVFVDNAPYKLINFSDRRQYKNAGGYCYVDLLNNKLYFTTSTILGKTISFDYIHKPANLTLATSPIFPEDYYPAIYHGMASADYIIQQFDKARSYSQENKVNYLETLEDMMMWNAKLSNY